VIRGWSRFGLPSAVVKSPILLGMYYEYMM